MTANPAEQLRRLMAKGDLTPEEELALKAAMDAAMVKVDVALAVVNAMIEEIQVRREKAREKAEQSAGQGQDGNGGVESGNAA